MQKKHRLCALMLIITLFFTLLTPMYANAEELSFGEDFKLVGEQSFIKTEDENGSIYYGTTGNDEIGKEPSFDISTVSTPEDYYNITNGGNSKKAIASLSASEMPSFVDNSTSIYFPEIGNQGSLGSCTCWAQVYYQFTYMMNKDRGVATTAENTYSPQWSYNVVAGTTDNIGPYYVAYSFMKNQGNVFLSQVPYTLDTSSISPTEEIWKTSIKNRIEDFYKFEDIGDKGKEITSADDDDLIPIKTAISNGDILAYSTYISSWKTTTIKTNSSAPENNKYANEEAVWGQIGKEGGHRMTIVGYNDDLWIDINNNDRVDSGETGAFKIANSWGDTYANKGFNWIAYDALNEVSCVEGVEHNSSRQSIFSEISGITILKQGTNADIYLKYTVNTADRSQVSVNLIAEKDGTIYNRSAYSNEKTGVGLAYDGSNEATDATMILLMNNVADGIKSDNFSDYDFSVRFEDNANDSNILTVKNTEIIDETKNKVYKVSNTYPFTLNNEEKTVQITQNTLDHAVVYYRGYKAPSINYKLENGSFLSENVLMEATTERRGYTHKFVIDLKGKNNAKLYFTDSENAVDNNNGAYFTAKRGLNYYVTENVCDPVDVKVISEAGGVNDVNNLSRFTVEASGGYEPYLYRYTAKNLETGKEEIIDYTEDNTDGFYFREEGKHRVTVDVKDFSDAVSTSYIDIEIKNLPFEFESLTSDSYINLVGNEIRFVTKTKNEQIKYTGRVNNDYTFEIKDSSGNTVFTNTKKGDNCNMNYRYSETAQKYTPQKSGVYTITVSSTDGNKEYAEISYTFKVVDKTIGDTDGSGDITVMDATNIQRYLVNLIKEPTIMPELSDCDKSELVNIMDATYIQRYLAHADKSAFVGEVIEYIPPTEPQTQPPTVPTEKPTDALKNNKVTFTNSFYWSDTMYCYYWSDTNTNMVNWPGKAMSNIGTNDFGETMYSIDLPQDVTYIIFTNGAAQTTDISYSGGEVRYFPLNTTDSKGNKLVSTW